MNEPKVGTLSPSVIFEKGEGGEGTPQSASSPIFEKQSLLTGAYTVAVPHPSPSQGPHSQECMEPLPWESWGAGVHPSPGMFGCVRRWAGGSEGAKK